MLITLGIYSSPKIAEFTNQSPMLYITAYILMYWFSVIDEMELAAITILVMYTNAAIYLPSSRSLNVVLTLRG